VSCSEPHRLFKANAVANVTALNAMTPLNEQSVSTRLVSASEILTEVFPGKTRPSVRTWARWQKAGIIPCVKIGRRVFFDPARVAAALRSREAKVA
jgi:hypothetical protein